MDFIQMLRGDQALSELMRDVCDVEIFPEFREPEDEFGHLSYNIPGRTFARAGSGSEYILLADGSVGFWGSEGACGRLADSLEEFFELVVNCPYWMDYLDEGEYQDREDLREYAAEIFQEHMESAEDDGFDLLEAQRELAGRMGIVKAKDAAELLARFYRSARREPRFISTNREDDGSVHSGTGSVFDR